MLQPHMRKRATAEMFPVIASASPNSRVGHINSISIGHGLAWSWLARVARRSAQHIAVAVGYTDLQDDGSRMDGSVPPQCYDRTSHENEQPADNDRQGRRGSESDEVDDLTYDKERRHVGSD
jgi:hypothetical protein